MNRLGMMVILVAACAVVGCEKKQSGGGSIAKAPPEPVLARPPEITSETEEGFADLVFYIAKVTTESDGSHRLRAEGLYKGQPLGLEVVLAGSWKPSAPDKNIPFKMSTGTVAFRSIGPESDAFVRALDEIYGIGVKPTSMAAATTFTGMSLEGDPGNLAGGMVKIKCFYEPANGKDNEGAEFFTNIDLTKNRFELREKDDGYRPSIVRALRAK